MFIKLEFEKSSEDYNRPLFVGSSQRKVLNINWIFLNKIVKQRGNFLNCKWERDVMSKESSAINV